MHVHIAVAVAVHALHFIRYLCCFSCRWCAAEGSHQEEAKEVETHRHCRRGVGRNGGSKAR